MYEREFSEREQLELIRRAKECDPSAFATIYDHYYLDIYNYIYHRVANVQLAEDLVSEVFLKVLESIDSFTFRGIPLSAWLFRLARNLLIDYFRTSPRPGVEVPLEEEVVLTEGGPDAALERKVTRKQLLGALSNLTEDQKEVVVLKFMEGFSNTDVAKIVGRSEGAVKSLQHRALSTLSRILEIDQTSEVSLSQFQANLAHKIGD